MVVVALCWTAKLDFQSRYANAILAATSAGAPDPNGKIDTAARQATADGNALLLFRGFSPDKGRDTHLISKAYFRGNYAAYPQRLFACDDAVAFDPNQIVAGQFAPTDTWLAEHNIHCILRVALDPAGNFVFAVHRL